MEYWLGLASGLFWGMMFQDWRNSRKPLTGWESFGSDVLTAAESINFKMKVIGHGATVTHKWTLCTPKGRFNMAMTNVPDDGQVIENAANHTQGEG